MGTRVQRAKSAAAKRQRSRNILFYLCCILGGLFGTYYLKPVVGQGLSDISTWADTLHRGLDLLGGKEPRQEKQEITKKASEAYNKLLKAFKDTDRVCRSLTATMRTEDFARSGLWLDITAQLQKNGQADGATGYESRLLLSEFKNQLAVYDQSRGVTERLAVRKIDVNSRDFRDAIQRYFTHPQGMDVCRVGDPFGQLDRFSRVQRVLSESNPELANRAMQALGPAVLKSLDFKNY